MRKIIKRFLIPGLVFLSFFLAGISQAAVPVIASSASYHDTGNSTSRTINKPSGTASGDWLFLAVSIDAAATVTTPTGFTLVEFIPETSSSESLYLFKRKADGTEGSTFTIASTSEYTTGIIARITGADSTDCVDVISVAQGEVAFSGNILLPNAYAISDDSLILRVAAVDGGAVSISTPTSNSLIVYEAGGTSGTSLMMSSQDQATAGYTGSSVSVAGLTTEEAIGVTVVIRSTATPATLPAHPIIRNFSYVMPASSVDGTLNKPYGIQSGDTLLLLVETDTNSFTTTGYTLIQESNVSTTIYAKAYYRIADGSEAATFTPFPTAAGARIGAIARIANADTSSPIDTSSANTGTSTTPTATTITPTVNNTLLIWLAAADDDDSNFDDGYPSGWDGLISVTTQESADTTYILAKDEQTTATATGSVAGSIVASEEWVALMFAVKPYTAPASIPESTDAIFY